MKSINLILTSIFLLSAFTMKAQNTFACSCIPPSPPQESLEQSDAVFSGTVKEIKESGTQNKVSFELGQVWKKNDLQTPVTVATQNSSAACGYTFEVGQKYMVYANETERELSVSLCSRTTLLANASEDLETLGEGETLVDNAASDDTQNNDQKDSLMWTLWSIGALSLASLLVYLWKHRK